MSSSSGGGGLVLQPKDEQQAKFIFQEGKENILNMERSSRLLLNGGFCYEGERVDIMTSSRSTFQSHLKTGITRPFNLPDYKQPRNGGVQKVMNHSTFNHGKVVTFPSSEESVLSQYVQDLNLPGLLSTSNTSTVNGKSVVQVDHSKKEGIKMNSPMPSRSVKVSPFTLKQVSGNHLRLKISKGTRVVEPPPADDVIVIDDDDDDKITSVKPKLHLVTVPESAQERKQEDKPSFPNKFLPNMHLLDIGHEEDTFIDVGPKKSQRIAPVHSQGQIVSQPSETTNSQGFTETNLPIQENQRSLGSGLSMRLEEEMSNEDIMKVLDLLTPFDIDMTMLDLDEKEEEETTIKYTKYQPYKVVHGEKEAIVDLLNHKEELSDGVHGVICDALQPSQISTYNRGDFEVKKRLGAGSYGTVELCVDKKSSQEFVRKKVTKDFRVNEVLIMLYLDHVNITKLYGYIHREGQAEVYMEYVGMNLLQYTLLYTKCPDHSSIWDLSKQGLSALEYLDNHGILHLDIKPENICLMDSGSKLTLKLMDFGSAKTAVDKMDFQGLTAEYMAPEISRAFLRSHYPLMFQNEAEDYVVSGRADIFSFALVIMFMYQQTHVLMHFFTQGKASYKDVPNPDRVRLQIIAANAKKPDTVRNLMITDKCNPEMKILLEGMLTGQPKQRLSAKEVLCKMNAMEKGDIYQQPLSPMNMNLLKSYLPVVSPAPRQRTNTVTSVTSMEVGSPESPGPVSGVGQRRRQRRRSQKPYGGGEGVKEIQVATDIQGNVPNFLMM